MFAAIHEEYIRIYHDGVPVIIHYCNYSESSQFFIKK